MASHFVLCTFGSLGDLHPYIAVALGLRSRGHAVTIAASEVYRAKVEGEGLGFRPVRPDVAAFLGDPELFGKLFHPRTGSEYIYRCLLMPVIEESYADLLDATRDADLIVGHPATFAVPTVAEVLKKRWVSVALQPIVMLSAYDPPVISGYPLLQAMRGAGPWFWKPFLKLARRQAKSWGAPLNRMRKKLGLAELADPVFDGMFSPHGTHCWFSTVLGHRQVDWPAETTITGFPFYDKLEPGKAMSAELREFLAAGPAPVVFTLGSSAVHDAGSFYQESVAAVRQLGMRAVLLTGHEAHNLIDAPGDSIFVAEYAPYSELLPLGAATVHQGGVGTTGQALRSARPMIVVPWAHDQPDNGSRVARLGAGLVIPRTGYRASRVAVELDRLLRVPGFAETARRVASVMASENGVETACDALEKALSLKPRP